MTKITTLLLTALLLSLSPMADAAQKRLACQDKNGINGAWNLTMDTEGFRGSGYYPVKVDGLYDKQTLITESTSGRRQLTLQFQTGAEDKIIAVRSAEDAKVVWQEVRGSDPIPAAVMSPKRIMKEYDINVAGNPKKFFLALHRDPGSNHFSYAGFCHLSLH